MTLKPGDIVVTGTPVKKGSKPPPSPSAEAGEAVWLRPGDTIEVECPQIGVLRNTVAAEA